MEEARDYPSVATGESQKQERRQKRGTKQRNTVQFASLMGICHSKHAELEPQFQKYKGRLVLRADTVKDAF